MVKPILRRLKGTYMSKGSKQRPTDLHKFRENYDKIFDKPVKEDICVLTVVEQYTTVDAACVDGRIVEQ